MVCAIEIPVQLGIAHDDTVVRVAASIGVAVFPDDGVEPQELTRMADLRMYRHKEERRRLRSGSQPAKAELTLQTKRDL